MLRIYPICLDMVREVRLLADRIRRFDFDQARQLKRSSMSVLLNVAEGSGSQGGRRRMRYEDALGSARETVANLEAAHTLGYVEPLDPELRNWFNQIIGTLVTLVR